MSMRKIQLQYLQKTGQRENSSLRKRPHLYSSDQMEKTLEAFGYAAEDKYVKLAKEGEHKKWYYFRRFKMLLMDKIELKRNVTIKDETGRELCAKTVFSMAIKFLKDDLLNESSLRVAGGIRANDIMWVLTVPAIWNDSAKQVMREAAVEAGIGTGMLRIALEPEAASMFCRLLPMAKMLGDFTISALKVASTYMVLDAGDGKLQEITKASGGAWGGTRIDEAYRQLIISIVGNPVFQKFVHNHMDVFLDMTREFEVKKRDIDQNKDAKVTIRFPTSLKDFFEEETGKSLKEAIQQSKLSGDVTVLNDKLRIDARVMRGLFDETLQSIIAHLRMLMDDPGARDISGILIVGGFSESKMSQDAIRINFREKKVIVPQEAGLVVLKGAVVFGHDPCAISERIAKFTYGVAVNRDFIEGKHELAKSFVNADGIVKCADIFKKYVEIGQTLHLNEELKSKYIASNSKKTSYEVELFASKEKNPKYVTDYGCFKLGQMLVEVDTTVPLPDRSFTISLSFGDTEIHMKAFEESTGK
ncbi:hypothetical protein CHS0354_016901 [Potamilus streckersoni]|uniref:Heat shock protein 70 n=1 Tax=Potamilus streckersoni TaxID=2493646 RepID=A0AAE0SLL0_9BIVA|nr:hypothetical protein CHS0354_016901 [Potamilus streckersoni]